MHAVAACSSSNRHQINGKGGVTLGKYFYSAAKNKYKENRGKKDKILSQKHSREGTVPSCHGDGAGAYIQLN